MRTRPRPEIVRGPVNGDRLAIAGAPHRQDAVVKTLTYKRIPQNVAAMSQRKQGHPDRIAKNYDRFSGDTMSRRLLFAGAALALVAASPAFAADMPAPAYTKAPAYVAPIFNWTGFYVGGHAGGAWANQASTEIAPGTAAFPTGAAFSKNNLSGFLGGVQTGYNWQVNNNFVVGVEGEYSWANVTGAATTVGVGGFTSTVSAKTKDYALATGRVGYAADNWLFYAKGGGAWSQTSSTGTGVLAGGAPFDTTSASSNRSGWVVGGGVEWGFAPNWSAKIEYNHIDFGSSNVVVTSSKGTTSNISSSDTAEVVKGGVNYRFNWGGPVVANY
jgi:outer membrane immunogenic protein